MNYRHKGYRNSYGGQHRAFRKKSSGFLGGWRFYVFFLLLLLGSNFLMVKWRQDGGSMANISISLPSFNFGGKLYLIEHAKPYITDIKGFTKEVKRISKGLKVPSSWLMAVMYAESKFDPAIKNLQGSGAVGLIQFSPQSAERLGTSPQALRQMHVFQQLDYVEQYFHLMRREGGDFQNLTDMYLALVYPPARTAEKCGTLFQKPSRKYHQHFVLDENKDGAITCYDIDIRLQRLFPEAYKDHFGR